MNTVTKSIAAMLMAAGVNGYAQDFAGADFYEGLRVSREELRGKAEAAPVPQAVPVDFAADDSAPAAVKEWTVMVFINGKNDLEPFGLQDINEMERVGSNAGLNIVVELGQMSTNRMQRYLVTRDSDTARVSSRLLGDASGIDMGDPAAVREFVLWAERRFPARKYMLILWDHGSGWLKGNPVEEGGEGKGISDDFLTGHNISTPQLGRLARDIEAGGGRVDLLAMDACLMQMAEVAYEFKDSRVQYIAASQEIEPGDGYPYDRWLAPLAANPGLTARQLGITVARQFLAANREGFRAMGRRFTATYSVLDLAGVRELGRKMDALARAAMAAGDKAAVLRARGGATRYAIEDNKDLRQFALLLSSHTASAEVRAAAAELERLIMRRDGGPVAFSGVSAAFPNRSFGVAAYIPESAQDMAGYGELKLSADTQWDEFVNWLLRP